MQVVCFDLGGVLVRVARSWEEAAQLAGFDPGPAKEGAGSLLRAFGHHADLQRGAIAYEHYLQREAARLEGALSTTELDVIHRHWLLEEYAGVADLVGRIHEAGIRTATLSNTDVEHWKILSKMPSVAAIGTHGLSFELGLIKPSTEIYHALEEMVDATGASIGYLDDLEENVEAALRCGWTAIWIDPHEETAPQIERALESFGIAI